MSHEAHQDGQQADDAVHALHGRLRRMSGVLPVCLQDFLHGGQPALREVSRGIGTALLACERGFFCVFCGCGKCYGDTCLAHSTQTPRSASDRVLVRLNTGALLKRASLERKKYAGGESHTLLTCFTRVCFGATQGIGFLSSVTFGINSVFYSAKENK